VPAESTLVTVVRQKNMSDFDRVLDATSIAAIEEMFAEVEHGREVLENLFEEACTVGEYRAIVIYLQALKMTWQTSCAEARIALLALDRIASATNSHWLGSLANCRVPGCTGLIE
jgi:hypothetical protein